LLVGLARPLAGGLLAGCVIFIAVLGIAVAGQSTADRVDRAVDAPLLAWFAGHQVLALWMAYPATLVPAGAVSLIAALACLARGWLRGAVLALLAVPVASGLNDALFKPLFHRTYEGALTYPSGHTSAMAALASALTVLLLLAPRRSPAPLPAPTSRPTLTARPALATALRWAIPAVAWLAVVVVAIGVIGVRWHYFTDTLGGAALGTGSVCALALLLDISWPRRTGSSSRPGSASGGWRRSRSEPGRSWR
jgi:undecaprenyl-diphosphatase